ASPSRRQTASREMWPASTRRSASGPRRRSAMPSTDIRAGNIKHAVPVFGITDIEASLRFYVDGLGFAIKYRWAPDGRIRWCWLGRDRGLVVPQATLERRR